MNASALIGIPYRPLGRDDSGLDCLGLVLRVMRAAGLAVDDPLSAEADAVLCSGFSGAFRECPAGDVQPFDVARLPQSDGSQHLAVVLAGGLFQASKHYRGVVLVPWRQVGIEPASYHRHREVAG